MKRSLLSPAPDPFMHEGPVAGEEQDDAQAAEEVEADGVAAADAAASFCCCCCCWSCLRCHRGMTEVLSGASKDMADS